MWHFVQDHSGYVEEGSCYERRPGSIVTEISKSLTSFLNWKSLKKKAWIWGRISDLTLNIDVRKVGDGGACAFILDFFLLRLHKFVVKSQFWGWVLALPVLLIFKFGAHFRLWKKVRLWNMDGSERYQRGGQFCVDRFEHPRYFH